MKRLVLSEGRRDVRLVDAFYTELDSDVAVKTFHGEDVAYERLKNKESDEVRNFLERRNPYDVLAKSENGKPDLKQIFTKLIWFLSRQDVTLTLLIDLDGTGLQYLLADLDERVETNYDGKELGIRVTQRLGENSEQITAVAKLYSKDDESSYGDFEIIAFKDDLEATADIDGSEDTSVERRKLRQLVTDERATAPMRSMLL